MLGASLKARLHFFWDDRRLLNLYRDRDDLQQEELAASLQMGRGSLDHGGESHIKQQHQIDNINQGAEEFLKKAEGAQILKTSVANVNGEEEGNQKEKTNIYELIRKKKESTN